MCVRSFAAIVLREMLVDDATAFIQQFDGNSSFGSRGRHGETSLHVFDDLQCRAAEWNHFAFGLRRGCRSGLWLRCRRPLHSLWTRRAAVAVGAGLLAYAVAVANQFGEIGAPRVVDQFRVAAEPLEQTLDIRGVCAEFLGNHLG
jgi:hypothetical protein